MRIGTATATPEAFMAGTTDKVFLRAFKWLKASVQWIQDQVPDPIGPNPIINFGPKLGDILRQKLGLQLDQADNAVDPATFKASMAAAQSLAMATLITGETLTALKTLGKVLDDLAAGNLSLDDLAAVIGQIDRILNASTGQPPSAYSLAKLLLILSGDVDEADGPPHARRLVYLLMGKDPAGNDAGVQADLDKLQAIVGLAVIFVGTLIDRAFPSPGPASVAPAAAVGFTFPTINKSQTFQLIQGNGTQLNLTLGLDEQLPLGPGRLYAQLQSTLDTTTAVGSEFQLALTSSGLFGASFDLPDLSVQPLVVPKPQFDGDINVGLKFARKSTTKPLVLGKADGTNFSIGELSGSITLHNTTPQLEFDLKDSKLTLKVGDDSFLSAILGDAVEVALTFGLVADIAGGLRLKDGTGLKATIPLEKIPNSPVQIPFLTFELSKGPNLNQIDMELSGSFQVSIGPFGGSIDRLGTKLNLNHLLGLGAVAPTQSWGLKPPSGAGLVLDAGIVKGGGFLLFDPDRGEYGGILDLKIAMIGVKAIGLLGTKNPGGWSLLLIITAQLPPIQLGFGFTLTGIGGLLGVQHTVSIDALSSGLTTGSLDSFLFPQNPIANAPQIFNQLRVIFPFKAGGFIIGPMLELGWGTPSLVTARVGILIEPSQLVFVGQVIVQLPPAVDKSLALLRLQVDFAGGIVFDPLKIWFDGVLRDSRVLFINLTGQFAFRAIFGDQPSFLISAGGFHPRFTDLPPGLPSPFQRIGADFSLGIVGMQFKGYFAVTSATVQGGSSMRVWADVGIASFEGGFEFNAIIYLKPKFRFECDIHVFAGIEVFGIDFASVDIYGLFAGPGRWHIVGKAEVHTPWPLPDFHFHVDESWGEDRSSNVTKRTLASVFKPEVESAGNWSAQLPAAGDAFVTLAKLPPPPEGDADKTLLAHPNAALQFTQKRLPLAKKLDKLGTDEIDKQGDDQKTALAIDKILFGAGAAGAPAPLSPDRRLQENFAAAQFIETKEDDLLHKPSFERFESGFEVGQSDYSFGRAVVDVFDYEERNLSTPVPGIIFEVSIAQGVLVTQAFGQSTLANGAAGRSARRRAEALKPEVDHKIAVNPPALQVLDAAAGTMTGTALAGAASQSVWHAQDHIAAQGKSLQLVEAFETVQAF